jgi:hypothetical protein
MDSKVYPILKKGVYNLFILGKIFFKCIPECFYQKKKKACTSVMPSFSPMVVPVIS